MTTKVRRWRPALWVLALAVAVSAVPVPLLAQEKSPPAGPPGIQASIQKAVTQTPLTPAKAQAARTQGTAGASVKKSFFKTPAGILVLAIIGVGTGYAMYSTKHDSLPNPAWSAQTPK